jgi:hypothetical protein
VEGRGVSPKRTWIYAGILAAVTAATVEGIAFFAGRVLAERGIMYVPKAVDDYADYLGRRDPRLGWPLPDFSHDPQRDETGSRIVPAFPDPESESCVSIYGDSFTWSSEVGHEEAWGNVLARSLGCRVANFGTPGYGTDQALMRYRANEHDASRVVILAHQPENILRNVNQYRALLYPSSLHGFKPRFIVNNQGALVRVDLPEVSVEDYAAFVAAPEDFLAHEYFAPGGDSGTIRLSFPYTWSVLRGFGHFHIRTEIEGVPWYTHFYESGHRSGGLEVTAAILRTFVAEAKARGQQPFVMILPTGLDFELHAENGLWVFQPLLDALHREGIAVANLGEDMAASMSGRSYCEFISDCSGHYNTEGYAMVASIVATRLESRGLYFPMAHSDSVPVP